ncbi:hypothetical protein GQX74_014639 [Glossina fuscipes]|nr:hypothetical protein GQX74_014639 [Glossina fuscipes]
MLRHNAPKLYQRRQSVNVPTVATDPHIDINAIQFDKNIAEEAIKAARASSTLQSFQSTKYRKKDRKTIRVAGSQVWEDRTLADWRDDDFRTFCCDLSNEINDEVLTRTINNYPSFQRARVSDFLEPKDFIKTMKEMHGRYAVSRPIELNKLPHLAAM